MAAQLKLSNRKKDEGHYMADSFKKHLIVNYKWRSLPVRKESLVIKKKKMGREECGSKCELEKNILTLVQEF